MPRVRMPKAIPDSDLGDWADFKLKMLSNPAYDRVRRSCADALAVGRVETFFAVKGEALALIVQLWGLMLGQCPKEALPTAPEAAQWAKIARDASMPISFADSGQMTLAGSDK